MFLSRTPPTELPFDFAALRRHCRVTSSLDDEALKLYAWAAIRQGEFITNRVWAQCEWTGELDTFPAGIIQIPKSPCTELTRITYKDANLTEHTLDETAYRFMPSSLEWDGGRPFAGISSLGEWPAGENITITFKAGWPGQSLPEELKNWIFIKVSGKYEQREDLASATRKIAIPFPRNFADGLLDPYYLPKVRR